MKQSIRILILITIMTFLFTTQNSYAIIKIFTRTIKQSFGGSQSPDDARVAAIAKAKREVLEEAGTYIESTSLIKDHVMEKDEILALSAGVLNARIIDQKNYSTNETFGIIIVAEVVVDTSILEKRIKKLLSDNSILEKYIESQKREKDLLARIAELEKQNKNLKSSPNKNPQQQSEELIRKFKTATQELNAIGYYNKATALWVNRQYTNLDKALEYLNKAIQLNPKYAEAYNNRGIAWFDKGKYNRAIKDYDKVIELNPEYAYAYSNRGLALQKIGKNNKAIADYHKTLDLDKKHMGPEHTTIAVDYNNLGEAHKLKKEYKKAAEYYKKALNIGIKRLGPEHPHTLVYQRNYLSVKNRIQ